MSETANHIQKTLEIVLGQLHDLERQAVEKKRTVNDLCHLLQQPPMFPDFEATTSGVSARPDEYYGRLMPDVIQSVLEKRKRANLGAATVNEIFEGMISGGYYFQTRNAAYAKRGIYGILAADQRFHRLPGGRVGLAEWYPAARLKGESEAKAKYPQKIRGRAKKTRPLPKSTGKETKKQTAKSEQIRSVDSTASTNE